MIILSKQNLLIFTYVYNIFESKLKIFASRDKTLIYLNWHIVKNESLYAVTYHSRFNITNSKRVEFSKKTFQIVKQKSQCKTWSYILVLSCAMRVPLTYSTPIFRSRGLQNGSCRPPDGPFTVPWGTRTMAREFLQPPTSILRIFSDILGRYRRIHYACTRYVQNTQSPYFYSSFSLLLLPPIPDVYVSMRTGRLTHPTLTLPFLPLVLYWTSGPKTFKSLKQWKFN